MKTVLWTIDMDAPSALSASIRSFITMQRRGTTACVFDVVDEAGNERRVDLQEAFESDAGAYAEYVRLAEQEIEWFLLIVEPKKPPYVVGPYADVKAKAEALKEHSRSLAPNAVVLVLKLSPLGLEVVPTN